MVDFNDLDEVTQEHDGVSGVYAIVNTNTDKFYIGSSVSMWKRRYQHTYKLRKGEHCNGHLQASWAKHGEDAFRFLVMIECDDCRGMEQFYLDWLKPYVHGYNICNDVEGAGHGDHAAASKLTKAKVAEARERYRSGAYAQDLSEEYGVEFPTMTMALRGQSWSQVPNPVSDEEWRLGEARPSISDDEARRIRLVYIRDGLSMEELGRRNDVSAETIAAIIKADKNYSHLGDDIRTGRNMVPKGSDAYHSKLTECDVAEMRDIRREVGTSFGRLAKAYGVSKRTARLAIQGNNWTHVRTPPVPCGS